MKVIIYSPAFAPQIGGLEEIARICAAGLTELGHQVTVICETDDEPHVEFPFRVLRRASWLERLRVVRACDVFLMFNMSLKGLPLALLYQKPLVICHQGWYGRDRSDQSFRSRCKCWLSRRLARNIACSQAVADYVGGEVEIVPNAYNAELFRHRPEIRRDRDVLFVGRLVSDKGCGMLVTAFAQLAAEGLRPSLTITGSGPEEPRLREQVAVLGLADHIHFTGALRGTSLAEEMNRHRILVVPSVWEEPFGIVALEGMASGCLVIGSQHGGLADAIGPCGLVFENGSHDGLVKAMKEGLEYLAREEMPASAQAFQRHLNRHGPTVFVQAIDSVLKWACNMGLRLL